MSDASDKHKQSASVQTTGHAWDGDLQEYNNPLPRWWVWAFYATVVFAVVYWFLYPAWPLGEGYTTGLFNRMSYEVGGEQETTHWNSRARFIKQMQTGEEAVKQREYMEQIADASYQEILADPNKMAFARSMAKGLFGDNCAPCHGSGGGGVAGLYPNLVDDAWLWGGTVEAIEETIHQGRLGFMPGYEATFTEDQLDAVTEYVLSLSEIRGINRSLAAQGKAIFQGQAGGCHYCHTAEATGRASVGSANLTDSIWTVARVPEADTVTGKRKAVEEVIRGGIQRRMPGWDKRLSDTQIKLLTAYVHELGGGQ